MSALLGLIAGFGCWAFSGYAANKPLNWDYFIANWGLFPMSIVFGLAAGAIWEWVYTLDMKRRAEVDASNNQKDIEIAEWQAKNAAFQLHNQGQILAALQRDSLVTPEGHAALKAWHDNQVIAEKEWMRDNPYPNVAGPTK